MMRALFLSVIIIANFLINFAQHDKPIIYLSIGSISNGSKLSIDYIQGHHIFEISHLAYGYLDNNIPNDYQPASSFGYDSKPHVFLQSGSVAYGFSYQLDKVIRLNSKIGISYNFIENPENYQPQSQGSNFWYSESNYSYDRIKSKEIGLLLNPEIQFIVSRVNALSLGFDLNLMKEHSRLLFEFSFEFGRLRDKKMKKEK